MEGRRPMHPLTFAVLDTPFVHSLILTQSLQPLLQQLIPAINHRKRESQRGR